MASRAIERARIWRWQRDPFRSMALRRWFCERHRIDVGLYSYGCFDQWRMPGPLIVGRYCSIAKTVRSAPINHPLEAITTHPALYERKFGVVDADIHYDDPQVIEDDVWIGHHAIILPGCRRIGRGSVIGAGAIVTRDVPRYAVVVGNPARVVRERFPRDVQAALEQSRWWELDLTDLRALVQDNPALIFHPTSGMLRAWTGLAAAA
ncbi:MULTISPECIES: CatB-related O-acetyltransferase [unclassified Sphingomonas]|uniref:CatB-related O-acetyltransferase n=1 Tax=unclassified Sphingomonas TaxID=196159 RepID=UPI002AAFAA43|nr:CatB-related O-acetyltransferase [Sphingomonas sp. IC4-52]